MNEQMIVAIAVRHGRTLDQPDLAHQLTAQLAWEAWTPIERLLELPREAEELIDAAGADSATSPPGAGSAGTRGSALRPRPGASPGPSPSSPTASAAPDRDPRGSSGRSPDSGSDAIAPERPANAANSQATHVEGEAPMKNATPNCSSGATRC
jgi:hypothetical protein